MIIAFTKTKRIRAPDTYAAFYEKAPDGGYNGKMVPNLTTKLSEKSLYFRVLPGWNEYTCKESTAYHFHEGRFLLIYSKNPKFNPYNIKRLLDDFAEALKWKPVKYHFFSDTSKAFIIKFNSDWTRGLLRRSILANLIRFGSSYTHDNLHEFFTAKKVEMPFGANGAQDRVAFRDSKKYLDLITSNHTMNIRNLVEETPWTDNDLLVDYCMGISY